MTVTHTGIQTHFENILHTFMSFDKHVSTSHNQMVRLVAVSGNMVSQIGDALLSYTSLWDLGSIPKSGCPITVFILV